MMAMLRPEGWTPKDLGDGPFLIDKDNKRWGPCGKCEEENVYYPTHQCASTISIPQQRKPHEQPHARTVNTEKVNWLLKRKCQDKTPHAPHKRKIAKLQVSCGGRHSSDPDNCPVCQYNDKVLAEKLAKLFGRVTDKCHCGKPVYYYEDGFTRLLCRECSIIRCDSPSYNDVVYPCQRKK